jgi:hypothetical protein
MKNYLVKISLLMLLMFSFACTNNVNANTASSTINISNNDELSEKIEKIFQKDVIKENLDGKKISEVLKDAFTKLPEDSKKYIQKNYPEIPLDESYFSSDEKTYRWLSIVVKSAIKNSINKGELTQDFIDEYKNYLSVLGVSVPNIEIKKWMSDDDIEKLSLTLVDIIDKLANPTILKLLGIDLKNIDSLETIINNYLK